MFEHPRFWDEWLSQETIPTGSRGNVTLTERPEGHHLNIRQSSIREGRLGAIWSAK